ncbi:MULTISPECIES: GAF domain-containing sensor histidine kinase [Kitasatospora]|uniref:GAF domain-containing sensor histidine kinase n=1 Tax=Kitasatospora TaxID=2063 RepID=UPI0004C3B016|nr:MULTISPECIES: GAF domain-containing sensor histidine kinase [unclassified Kitasatospora]WAL74439.1 GAF domain-containing sensor histidine kinase [Kitasatospora sp. YST-16]WNW40504.1 GAF domain-containing sensor histidine kinase [Streptomyces sp. Li-HN-5-13]
MDSPGCDPSLQAIEAVSAAVLAMSRPLEVREVLRRITASARTLLGAEYAALGLPDDHGGFAQFVVDGVSDEQWRAIGPLPRQHGVLASMLHDREPTRLTDVRTAPAFGGWPDAHPDMTDFLGMPIMDEDEIAGALFLANKPGGFTDHDEELLRILVAHAALALGNARLYERSRELTLSGERARIAHDLHDAVSQKLFSLRLTARAAAKQVDRDPARARENLAEVARLAAEAADELRAVVVELRPAALEEDGLVATLASQAQVLDRAHSAAVAFTATGVRALPAAQEAAVLRVAQEALHNALRHAGAGRVTVTLTGTPPRGAKLTVRDDGRGFDPESVRRAGRHLGLVSMRDRAAAVGGRLSLESAPGRGTLVELEVPGA